MEAVVVLALVAILVIAVLKGVGQQAASRLQFANDALDEQHAGNSRGAAGDSGGGTGGSSGGAPGSGGASAGSGSSGTGSPGNTGGGASGGGAVQP